MITGVDAEVKMFQSALYPAAVTFSVDPSPEARAKLERAVADARGDEVKVRAAEREYNSRKKMKLMIKNGDDVRQDQLILQV